MSCVPGQNIVYICFIYHGSKIKVVPEESSMVISTKKNMYYPDSANFYDSNNINMEKLNQWFISRLNGY